MNRWNISHLIFYSKNQQRRTIEFRVNDVTIITGASNTGKSAIITAMDYCLGSSSCKIPAFIAERITHVASQWTDGTTEFFVAREISPSGKASGNMFIEYGSNIQIPENSLDLKGKGNIEYVKSIIETLFGIKGVNNSENELNINKISVRHITPYIYLDKEVIDSSNTLMYGLNDSNSSKHIVESLPYFLGAIDLEELEALKKLHGLDKAIESEEKKQHIFERHQTDVLDKCRSLLIETQQAGISLPDYQDFDKSSLIALLNTITVHEGSTVPIEDESIVKKLQDSKADFLTTINNLKRKKTAALQIDNTVDNFESTVSNQISKLELHKFFKHDAINCPLCNSNISSVNEVSKRIQDSLDELKSERLVVQKNKPAMNGYINGLDKEIEEIANNINRIDSEIRNLIKESEIAQKQSFANQNLARIVGRVSYFLDNHTEVEAFDLTKLNEYTRQANEIRQKYSKSRKQESIQIAEGIISEYATKNLSILPKGVPLENSNIIFLSKTPKIVIRENSTNKKYEFDRIGSDENYLSLHLSLAFAFQRFLGESNAPVPGILVLDQVSRPYYSNADSDIVEIGTLDSKVQGQLDDDTIAMAKHFEFIFDQVAEQPGLQVIVLEHAYLANNPQYVDAVKYRWPRQGEEKLIPSDWPIQ